MGDPSHPADCQSATQQTASLRYKIICAATCISLHYGVRVYSYDLAERMHVHVFKEGRECKVWLDDLTLAFNRGFKPHEVAEIRWMISERRTEIVERWLEHRRNEN